MSHCDTQTLHENEQILYWCVSHEQVHALVFSDRTIMQWWSNATAIGMAKRKLSPEGIETNTAPLKNTFQAWISKEFKPAWSLHLELCQVVDTERQKLKLLWKYVPLCRFFVREKYRIPEAKGCENGLYYICMPKCFVVLSIEFFILLLQHVKENGNSSPKAALLTVP